MDFIDEYITDGNWTYNATTDEWITLEVTTPRDDVTTTSDDSSGGGGDDLTGKSQTVSFALL